MILTAQYIYFILVFIIYKNDFVFACLNKKPRFNNINNNNNNN